MDQVDDLVRRDRRAGRSYASGRAIYAVQKSRGLCRTVAVDERVLLGRADAAGEFRCDVALHVEHGVLKQFVGHLDHGRHLVRADGDLTKSVVGFGNLAFLFHPAGGSVTGDDGNLAVAGLRADDGAQAAQLVFLGQRLHQRVLVLIRAKKTALRIGADLKGVAHLEMFAAIADHVPEGQLVFIRRAAGSTAGTLFGAGSQRLTNRLVHLAIHLLRTLHAVDGMTEVDHFLFHALVLLGILGAHYAAFIGALIQKSPGLVPDLGALLAHFKNLAHVVPPKLSVVGFDQIQPSA